MRSWDSYVLSQAAAGKEMPCFSAWESFKYHMSRLRDRPTLDIDVVSHCNLNCASCYHFSPIAEPSFLSPGELERDLLRLSRTEGIDGFFEAISLMGGEPLLHPDLATLVLVTRRCLPQTPIRLWTNGILLDAAPDELWDALSETEATLWLTPYPIGVDYQALADTAEGRGVRAVVAGGIAYDEHGDGYFLSTPIDPEGKRDPMKSFSSCSTGGSCMQLLDGKIYPCNKGALMGILNRRFGTGIEHAPDDYLMVADIRNAEEIDRFRRAFRPMCRYCALERTTRVLWKGSRRERAEWLDGEQMRGEKTTDELLQ